MASWLDVQAQDRQYHCLKELVVVGFNAVGWQIGFVRHVMKASPRMRRVHLLDGHVVEDKERVLEGLEVVPHTSLRDQRSSMISGMGMGSARRNWK